MKLSSATMYLFVCCFTVGSADYSFYFQPPNEPSEERAYAKLSQLEDKIRDTVETAVKYILPTLVKIGYETNITRDCASSLFKFLFDIKDMKNWAFSMLDATGKHEGGFFSGTLGALGSYEQCLDIEERTEKSLIKGKYCLVDIKPPLPPKPKHVSLKLPVLRNHNSTFKSEFVNGLGGWLFAFYDLALRFGVCVPSQCSKDDLQEIADRTFQQWNLNIGVLSCEVKEPVKPDNLQCIIAAILLAVLLVNLICTVIDKFNFRAKHNEEMSKLTVSMKMVRAFSISENFKKSTCTERRKDINLDFLDGIRFISMTWVVLGHAYCVINQYFLRSLRNVERVVNDIFFEAIGSGFLAVDTFIFIGGTVLSYAVIKQLDKRKFKTKEAIVLLVCRILRIWPSYLLTIGLTLLLPLIGSGPMWNDYTRGIANNCRKSWWANILFFNNYYNNLYDMCLSHTWYMSVDLQCFIVGIIYLVLLYKNTRYSNAYLALFIAMSISATGFVTYYFNYPPTILIKSSIFLDFRNGAQYMALAYTSTHVHLGVYCVGLFTGTLLARAKNIKLNLIAVRFLWTLSFLSGLSLIYGIHHWNQDVPYNQTEAIIYSSLQKFVWALLLCWISVACFSGNGGIVQRSLSWSGYRPLAQLSYLVYLIHYLIIIGYVADGQGLSDYRHSRFVFVFFGLLCVSHIVAFFLNILIESPLIQLTKIVHGHFLNLTDLENRNGAKIATVSNGHAAFHQNGFENNTPNCPTNVHLETVNLETQISRI